MSTKRELITPLSLFEPGESKGQELLLSFLGNELAYPLITLLASDGETSHTTALSLISLAYQNAFSEYYPTLSAELQSNPLLLREHLVKANNVIDYLQRIAFPHGKHIFSLLNPVAYTTTHTTKRLERLLANGSINTRYKYELLRQEVLMLASLAYTESRHGQNTVEKLNDLNDAFEVDLYVGRYGENQLYQCYSIHHNHTNSVLSASADFENVPLIDYQDYHFKQHRLTVRMVENIGPVLVRQREKSTESALIKAIYKGSQSDTPTIDISQINDPSGFMFVTETGKSEAMLQKVTTLIRQQYPNARIEEDHVVDKNRLQSDSLSWLRVQVFLSPTDVYPIEIIVFDQVKYFHYLYHLGNFSGTGSSIYPAATAHDLYELRRSYVAADLLFPQEIYGHNLEESTKFRKLDQEIKAESLLNENRVLVPSLS